MTCVSVTVSGASKPTISSLSAKDLGNQSDVQVTWTQDIAGSVKITVSNSLGTVLSQQTLNIAVAGAESVALHGLSVGLGSSSSTFSICVEAA